VSKNGNLMLNVPLQRGGQPDADGIRIVSEIGDWLKDNGEAIYATRPWKIYGEGPSTKGTEKGRFDGQKDVGTKPFTVEDIRFTQSKDGRELYAIVLEIPADGNVTVKSLANGAAGWPGPIGSVSLVSGGKLDFSRDDGGLHAKLPDNFAGQTALALKIRQ
jgi:alpha-L-fucosidase